MTVCCIHYHDELPELYPFVQTCVAPESMMAFGSHMLRFDESLQQVDPLIPFLVCFVTKIDKQYEI